MKKSLRVRLSAEEVIESLGNSFMMKNDNDEYVVIYSADVPIEFSLIGKALKVLGIPNGITEWEEKGNKHLLSGHCVLLEDMKDALPSLYEEYYSAIENA